MITFAVNGRETLSDQPSDTPLLWVIRDELGLTGTKFGCGMAQCGACTVHVNGVPTRSCVTPVSAGDRKEVNTLHSSAPPGRQTPGKRRGTRHTRRTRDSQPGAVIAT